MRGIVLWSALLMSVPAGAYEMRMRVVDETGALAAGADAAVSFVAPRQGGSNAHRGRTGPDGTFSARGETLLQLYLEANKAGQYSGRGGRGAGSMWLPGLR